MNGGAHGRNLVVRARGINTVGEKDDEKLTVRVDPNRSAGKTQMAKTAWRKVAAAGGIRRGDHPSKRARVGRERLRRDELHERRASQQALVRVQAAIEKHLAERSKVRRSREHSSVPSYAPHGERVFVVNFSPEQALTIGRVILRGSDAAAERLRRLEQRIRHAERPEDSLSRKLVNSPAGHALQDFPKQDEAQIGVNRLRARFVFERLVANVGERLTPRMNREVIIFVSREARRVGQQVPGRDTLAPLGVGSSVPFGNVARHWW